jgi:uncharacterized protein (TIGR02594 family)
MNEPTWMEVARQHIGLREIPGPEHNRTIQAWLAKLGAWWRDDETPWCGALVAHCLQEARFPVPKDWYRARAWAPYGVRVDPGVGAILVFRRPGGGGHVGFYAAEDPTAYHVLGGNQSNGVNVTRIAKSRLLDARWPAGATVMAYRRFATARGSVSDNEA